ncbi:MAG: cyclic nucleotide-binding domain-containing protein [Candidatus Glassbacteria bacterium]|nr:cyclic nucleotide-binding domain-containing protein [Candidatus Glassbacteria bacterium]
MKRVSALWGNIFKEQAEDKSIISILKRVPIFSQLTKTELNLIEKIVYLRNYHEDEIIFVEGEQGAGMYIIESGKVRICLGPNTDEAHEIVVLEAGDFFGDLALIDDAPRSATAVALSSSRLIGFFRSDLISIINRMPRMGVKIQHNILKILVRRLRKTDKNLNEIQEELRRATERTHQTEGSQA